MGGGLIEKYAMKEVHPGIRDVSPLVSGSSFVFVFFLPTCPFAALNTTAEASGSPRTTSCCGGRGTWTPGTPPPLPEHPHSDLGTNSTPVFAGTIAPPLSQDPEVHPSRAPLLPVDSPVIPKARLRWDVGSGLYCRWPWFCQRHSEKQPCR